MKNAIFFLLFLFTATASQAQGSKLKVTDLPKEAQNFLETHFKGEKIVKVKKESQIGEKGYEVELANGIEIEFTNSGHWREVDGNDGAIPTGYILPAITDYIKANYPAQKITHIDIGHKDIDVDISNNTDLNFTQDGKFLKAKQK
ncbi:PepSY-like domain-containing protein [Flavobacterium sp. MAH-1]|uniref:PepSY-like domain-containing protein n=1 Tax=Flavobacterium agri TaxID=2743471 RepID=A0A7Y9C851_9FLAO|nr:PepSY-like domain-containing protein [Flavobacterium agri]NUY82038.1 PepSY-like domain-containing protein [Flavobacterium agri]NYA72062.1 PepSY-like domain-containing protein [Flavobacterium agri]